MRLVLALEELGWFVLLIGLDKIKLSGNTGYWFINDFSLLHTCWPCAGR